VKLGDEWKQAESLDLLGHVFAFRVNFEADGVPHFFRVPCDGTIKIWMHEKLLNLTYSRASSCRYPHDG